MYFLINLKGIELFSNLDVCLATIAEETAYRSESLASRISQLALVDALYTIVMFSDENAASRSLKEVREVISTTRKA